MDRLTAARVFTEVADAGSLARAAERLAMSPAMVSRYLAAAEDWLGARLLHRSTRRISLTDAGQTALASCRPWLELAEEMQHRASGSALAPEARLRVSASASFADAQLMPALVDFHRLHPGVQLELVSADRAVDLVEERIDLAVRISNTLDGHLVSRRLADCRSVLCAAPAYLAGRTPPTTPEALLALDHVGHAHGSGGQYRLQRTPAPATPNAETAVLSLPVPAGGLRTDETLVLRRAVLAGAGVAMLPTYFVAGELQRGELVALLPGWEPERLGIHALYLSRRHQPLALRLLVDFLAQRFGPGPAPWDQALAVQAAAQAQAGAARRRSRQAAQSSR